MKTLLSALLIIFFSIISCSSPKKNESEKTKKDLQIFRMNLHSEMASLDPRLVRDIPSVTTAKMLFEGLMRMNDNGPSFAIAKEVTLSEDKKIYTFTLRPAFWSDGSLVTAYDFEYAWKEVLSPYFPAEHAHKLFILKNGQLAKEGVLPIEDIGVKALSEELLQVTLEYPNPYFLELVAFPITYPVKYALDEENPDWITTQGNDFICNGPFKLLHWRHNSELVAIKSPTYWEHELVKLDKIVLTMIEDEHTELNMYENDELDWAGSPNSSIPPEALSALKHQKPHELKILPLAATYCYKFNTKKEPFTSAKMRHAFSLAIDRKELIDNILQANQIVASSLIPPCMLGKDIKRIANEEGGAKKSYTHLLAQQLFDEALEELGYTRESMPSVTLIFSRSEKHQKMAQAVQQQWNETFGIKVLLQSYEWNTFIEKLNHCEYQVGGRGFISDLSDPLTLLVPYKSQNNRSQGGSNDTHWHNESYSDLLNQAVMSNQERMRSELLQEAEKILMIECPIAPLYHSTACYLKKEYVKGVYLSKLCDLDFKYAYLEKEI